MSTQGRAQFTPGPWYPHLAKADHCLSSSVWGPEPGNQVAVIGGKSLQTMNANAALIAAAPAMYEALSMAYNVLYMLKQGFPSEALCSENNPWGQDTGTLPDGKKVSCSAYTKKADEATAVALAQAEGRQA